MYNLLVTAGEGAWDESSYTLDLSRFLEHTEEVPKVRFSALDEVAIAALQQLPTLFAYEKGNDASARVGRIKTLQRRGRDIRITYEFNHAISPIEPKRLEELAWELEINDYEMNRTHWSVKEADLLDVLRVANLLGENVSIPASFRFSRATVINACDKGLSRIMWGASEQDQARSPLPNYR
ncbi:MAG: hypothetical protein EXR12_03530 [Rhodospirillaceae bacterium]|nr:hypothetical protein [Rhodospirillaceae bacterium]